MPRGALPSRTDPQPGRPGKGVNAHPSRPAQGPRLTEVPRPQGKGQVAEVLGISKVTLAEAHAWAVTHPEVHAGGSDAPGDPRGGQ